MPAITPSVLNDPITEFDVNLTSIFNATSEDWLSWFSQDKDKLNNFLTSLLQSFENHPDNAGFFRNVDAVLFKLYGVIHHQDKFDKSSQQIVGKYLKIVQRLCSTDYRHIFNDPSITLTPQHVHTVISTVVDKSDVISAGLMESFYSTLKMTFDVKKFLVEYQTNTLSIMNLAKKCFSSGDEEVNPHRVATLFFDLLGYQGQLFFYYKNQFKINESLLSDATQTIIDQAVELQNYFFFHYQENNKGLSRDLLRHYFYQRFLKSGIYREKPDYLANAMQDQRLVGYFASHYDPMPKRFSCNLHQDYKLEIRYKNLPENAQQEVCAYIKPTREQYFTWLNTLGPTISNAAADLKGHCTYYLSEDSDHYVNNLYAYGLVSRGESGMYQAMKVDNKIVYGSAFSYWSGDDERGANFVAGHETTHHYNDILYTAARKINKNLSPYLYRNINEGLASLFGGGACARDYFHLTRDPANPPDLSSFLSDNYIGYFHSWLYNNYIMDVHKDFYRDFLEKKEPDVINTWKDRIGSRKIFNEWFARLQQTCSAYQSINLVEDNFHSIALQDYAQKYFSTRVANFPEIEKQPVLPPTKTANFPSSKKPKEYYDLMNAIATINPDKVKKVIEPICLNTSIINYVDSDFQGEIPLHYALAFGENGYCSTLIVQQLIDCGAEPKISGGSDHLTAYDAATQRCHNWLEIQEIFNKSLSSTTAVNRAPLLPSTKIANSPTQGRRPVLRPTRPSNPPIGERKTIFPSTKTFKLPSLSKPTFYPDYSHLMRALGTKNPDITKEVIQPICGDTLIINYHDPERNGQTPLHYILEIIEDGSCLTTIVKQLIDCGARPEERDNENRTAYQFAAQHCLNFGEIKTIFDKRLLESSTTMRPSTLGTTIKVDNNSAMIPPIVETTSEATEVAPYTPKPYEYHIFIHVPTSVAKGSFTALSRYGFEKWQKNSSFAGRHPILLAVMKPMVDATAISSMNLIYFSKTKGMIFNLSEMAVGGIYFSVDLGLMFGAGLINSKVQSLLKPLSEKGNWLQKIPVNLGYLLLSTSMFFLSNFSLIFGEKAKGHELEVCLSLLASALLSSFVHYGVYNGIQFLENCCEGFSQQDASDPEENPELQSFLDQRDPYPSKSLSADQKASASENVEREYTETSIMLDPSSSKRNPEDILDIETLIDEIDKKIKSEKIKNSQALFEQIERLKFWAKNKYEEKSIFNKYNKNIKKLKISVPQSAKECIETLHQLREVLFSPPIKNQYPEHKFERIKYFIELFEQRLNLIDLPTPVEGNKINYLDSLKSELKDKIEAAKIAVSATIEKMNSKKNNSKAVIDFCKRLNILERSLLDMRLIAHIHGCYYAPLAKTQKILLPFSKWHDLDRGFNDIESVYKDLEKQLGWVCTALEECKNAYENLSDADKKDYLTLLNSLQQSMTELLEKIDHEKKEVIPPKWMKICCRGIRLFTMKQSSANTLQSSQTEFDYGNCAPLHRSPMRC